MNLKDTFIASLVPIFLGFGFVISKPAFDSFPPIAVIGGLSAPCTSADPLDSTPSCLVPTRVQQIEKTTQTPSQLKSIKILGKSQKSS